MSRYYAPESPDERGRRVRVPRAPAAFAAFVPHARSTSPPRSVVEWEASGGGGGVRRSSLSPTTSPSFRYASPHRSPPRPTRPRAEAETTPPRPEPTYLHSYSPHSPASMSQYVSDVVGAARYSRVTAVPHLPHHPPPAYTTDPGRCRSSSPRPWGGHRKAVVSSTPSAGSLSVLFLVDYLALPIDVERVSTHGSPYRRDNEVFRRHEPPFLMEDDEEVLTEPSAILHYLAEGTTLLPTDAMHRARMNEVVALHASKFHRLSSDCLEKVLHAKEASKARVIDAVTPAARNILADAEELLRRRGGGRVFLSGCDLTVADFLVAPELQQWAHLLQESAHPCLHAYFGRLAKVPGFSATARASHSYFKALGIRQ